MIDLCPECQAPVERADMEPVGGVWVTVLRPCGHTLLEHV